MRLDKYLAHATGESRKLVKQWVKSQRVAVCNAVITDAGFQVAEQATVRLDGRVLALLGEQYIMLHKPAGTVSTAAHADPRSVMALLPANLRAGLHVVGRLDLDTTGLMLLSSDGQWSHRITAPSQHCTKVYRAELADPVTARSTEALLAGVQLQGEKTLLRALALQVLAERCVEISLGEGRYHQVKRMFAAVGNHVVGLHRLQIGALALDPSLSPGQWRSLSAEERELVFH